LGLWIILWELWHGWRRVLSVRLLLLLLRLAIVKGAWGWGFPELVGEVLMVALWLPVMLLLSCLVVDWWGWLHHGPAIVEHTWSGRLPA
jgi:hypothetical protein